MKICLYGQLRGCEQGVGVILIASTAGLAPMVGRADRQLESQPDDDGRATRVTLRGSSPSVAGRSGMRLRPRSWAVDGSTWSCMHTGVVDWRSKPGASGMSRYWAAVFSHYGVHTVLYVELCV